MIPFHRTNYEVEDISLDYIGNNFTICWDFLKTRIDVSPQWEISQYCSFNIARANYHQDELFTFHNLS